MNNHKIMIGVMIGLIALIGCDSKPALQSLPEVSEENCTLGKIKMIKDKGTQQKFASQCARLGDVIKPSTPRQW